MPFSSRFFPAVAAVLVVLFVAAAVAVAAPRKHIDLPNGYQPEGVAAGRAHSLYVGSIPTGAVRTVDTRTGTTKPLVPAHAGRAAIGLKADGKRLFVAGGSTGSAFVYNARTGADVRQIRLAPDGEDTFVNDVAISKKTAYFTDSRRQALYAVDTQRLTSTELKLPDLPLSTGNNLNGIAATNDGRWLLAVQSNTGALWRIDPKTGATLAVGLNGRSLTNGDGLLLKGRTLDVVQNRDNRIAVVALARDYANGRITKTLTSKDFDVPTTLARTSDGLYAVNARFGTAPAPATKYWISRVSR